MDLQEFFTQIPKAAIAFSGGADSAFLMWAAKQYGCDARAYYVKTAFQPEFELEDARRLAGELEIPMKVVGMDILSVPEAADNGPDRCYYCKRALFTWPLRECGLTKSEVRKRSEQAGLFTWKKPAYACLATRIPTGTRIRTGDLERVEQAESLMASMGFRDFRIRLCGESARIQVTGEQMELVAEKRKQVYETLSPLFDAVLLDLEERIPSA